MTTAKKRNPAKKQSSKTPEATMTPEERYIKIQERAYLKAEADGFQRDSAKYWLAAEAEIG